MSPNLSEKELKARSEALEHAGLARDLNAEQLKALAELALERQYPNGAVILREDARSRDLYIIKLGCAAVQLTLPTDSGKDEVVYSMRDGQIFGELSLVDGSPRSATVRAEGDATVLTINYEALTDLLDRNPRIGYLLMRNIAGIISNRVRNTNMLWRNTLIW